jgi:hypothetical protein
MGPVNESRHSRARTASLGFKPAGAFFDKGLPKKAAVRKPFLFYPTGLTEHRRATFSSLSQGKGLKACAQTKD